MQGHIVRKLQPTARGKAMRDPRHPHASRRQTLGQVMRGGVTLYACSQGNHDFPKRFRGQTNLQGLHAQILGSNSIERREHPTQDMVTPLKRTRFLQQQHVYGPFNHAKEGRLPPGILAESTRLHFGQATAPFANLDAFARGQQCLGKLANLVRAGLDDVQREAFGGSGSDTRQPTELLLETLDDFGQHLYIKPGRLKPDVTLPISSE